MQNTVLLEMMLLLAQLFFDASGITEGKLVMSDEMRSMTIHYDVDSAGIILEAEGEEEVLTARRFEGTERFEITTSTGAGGFVVDLSRYVQTMDLDAVAGTYDFYVEYDLIDEFGDTWLLDVNWSRNDLARLSSREISFSLFVE